MFSGLAPRFVVAVALLCTTLSGVSGASQAAPSAPSIPGVEEVEDRILPDIPNNVLLVVSRWLGDQKIRLEASYSEGELVYGSDAREIAVPFWPTAITTLSSTEFVVAGTNARGFTVIEKWTLSGPPLVSYSLVPGGEPQFQSVSAPTVTSKAVLYIGNNPSYGSVSKLSPGWTDQLAIIFDGGRTLCRLPLEAPIGDPIVVASEGPAAAPVLQAASLSTPVDILTVRHHLTLGFVAMYTMIDYSPTTNYGVLIDQDEDGFFEQSLVVDTTQLAALGLLDASQFDE